MTLHFPEKIVECLDGSAPAWQDLADNANIQIDGDGNRVDLHFGSEEEAVALLKNIAFNILIVGNNNEMCVGKSLTACYTPGWARSACIWLSARISMPGWARRVPPTTAVWNWANMSLWWAR